MIRFSERDLRAGLELLGALHDAPAEVGAFAEAAVERLPRLVDSEFTTLSVCDLASGRRTVYHLPAETLGVDARAAFDRHFREHPLVRHHGFEGGTATRRISDSIPLSRFRRSALYADYYRRIGIDHAIALPLHVGGGLLVSFVLNRSRRDFSERERVLLDLLRPSLSRLYGRARSRQRLTRRETEVLRWIAAGKSDGQIGAILGVSARTVQKHLQHVYEKLGVENRTAAAMRGLRG